MGDTRNYNRIVIVGNGFDLALGLKTGYSHFLRNLLIKAIKECFLNEAYECSNIYDLKLIKKLGHDQKEASLKHLNQLNSVKEILEFIGGVIKINHKQPLFKSIMENLIDPGWVDIEQHYYDILQEQIEKYRTTKRVYRKEILHPIEQMNLTMDYLTSELEKFIIEQQNLIRVSYIESHFQSLIDKTQSPLERKVASLVKEHLRVNEPQKIIFLNFNYTNTVNNLLDNTFISSKNYVIHIHGEVRSASNPIIFGYGDDMGKEYKMMEDLNIDEILKKIKSFKYPQADNYHKLLNHLEEDQFDVFILGHSCGLSDRTLLKTIFEHKHCLAIQNFHYRGKEEDFSKRINISRHFDNKILMRERLLPFDKLAIIPQK